MLKVYSEAGLDAREMAKVIGVRVEGKRKVKP